jgi:competence protein ComEC
VAQTGNTDTQPADDINVAPYLLSALLAGAAISLFAAVGSCARGVEVTFLAVGDADCAVARVRGGRTILIDGGPPESQGSHSSVVLPFLLENGISHLDAIIISAGDKRRARAAIGVLAELSVGAVYAPREAQTTEFGRKLRLTCGIVDVPFRELCDGQRFHLGNGAELGVRIWHAGGKAPAVGLRVSHGASSALILNSVPDDCVDLLVRDPPAPADVFKLPEQGRAQANPEGLLESVGPDLAILSRALHGRAAGDFTSVRLVERLKARGVRILRTDVSGSITVRLDNGRVKVATFQNRGTQ